MISPRFSHYFLGVLGATVLGLVIFAPEHAGAYALAAAAVVIPTFLFPVPGHRRHVLLFAAASVWTAHLIRPVFLMPFPEFYMYQRFGQVTSSTINEYLLLLAGFAFAFLTGLVLCLWIAPSSERRRDAERDSARPPFLYRVRILLLAGLLVFLTVKLVLLLRYNVGIKGAQPTANVGFISEFLPEVIVYPVIILVLARYRRQLRRPLALAFLTVLVGYSLSTLLTGSKVFLANILLTLLVYLLVRHGDVRIPFRRAAAVALVVPTVILSSFSLSLRVKGVVSVNGISPAAIAEAVVDVAGITGDALVLSADLVTGRFIGTDGMIVVGQGGGELVSEAFRPLGIVERAGARLLPGVGQRGLSSGRAIGINLIGHRADVRHAGAIGLFAALEIMFGGAALLAAFTVGAFWGLYFALVSRARSFDLRFLLQYLGIYWMLRWVLSGNLDILLASLVVNLVQIAFYGTILVILFHALRRPATSVPRPSLHSGISGADPLRVP